jgi:Uma2 family endonuclease
MPNQLIESSSTAQTVADLWDQLGQVPLERILLNPPPGTANEQDLLDLLDGDEKRLCELVDGVIVEKPMGLYESVVATSIIRLMTPYFQQKNPGIVAGPDAPYRLLKGIMRLPDVSVVLWSRFSDRRNWIKELPNVIPDLAIEVLSSSNTRKEMDRKLREYFAARTELVWYIDPQKRTAVAFTSPTESILHNENERLDASPVLPGFSVTVKEILDLAGNPPEDD